MCLPCQYVHNLCTSYKHLSLLSATPSQSNMYMCQSMGWSGESRAISKFCSLEFFKHRTPPCQEWYIHTYIHMCVICGRPVLSCKPRKSPGHTAAYSPLLLWQQDNLSSHSISGCTGSGHKLSKCTITLVWLRSMRAHTIFISKCACMELLVHNWH